MSRWTLAWLPAIAFGVAFLFSAATPPAQPVPSGPGLHAAAPLPALLASTATPAPTATPRPTPRRRPAKPRAMKTRRPPRAVAARVTPVPSAIPTPLPTATQAPPPPPAPKPAIKRAPAKDFDSSGGFDSQG